jgi:hypothetical protein
MSGAIPLPISTPQAKKRQEEEEEEESHTFSTVFLSFER